MENKTVFEISIILKVQQLLVIFHSKNFNLEGKLNEKRLLKSKTFILILQQIITAKKTIFHLLTY